MAEDAAQDMVELIAGIVNSIDFETLLCVRLILR